MHQKINSSRPPPVPRGAGLQPLSLPPLNYVADISIILGQNNQEMSVQLSTTIRDSTQLIMSYKLSYDVTNHYRRIFCVMEVTTNKFIQEQNSLLLFKNGPFFYFIKKI